MTQCILHIGFGKTGSTALQNWLLQNAEQLKMEGFIYQAFRKPWKHRRYLHSEICLAVYEELDRLCPISSLQFGLGVSSRPRQKRIVEDFYGRLTKVATENSTSTFILSSEFLEAASRSIEFGAALKNVLAKIFKNTTILLYIRRQDEAIVSRYSQLAKDSPAPSLDEFLKTCKPRCYQTELSILEKVYGRSSLCVRLAAPDHLHGSSIIDDFCQVLGIAQFNISKSERHNASPSAATLEILRRFTKTQSSHFSNGYPNPHFRRIKAIIEKHDRAFSKPQLSQSDVLRIRQQTAKGNAWVCREYFPGRPELFPIRQIEEPSVSLNEEISDLACKVLEEMCTQSVFSIRRPRDLYEILRENLKHKLEG